MFYLFPHMFHCIYSVWSIEDNRSPTGRNYPGENKQSSNIVPWKVFCIWIVDSEFSCTDRSDHRRFFSSQSNVCIWKKKRILSAAIIKLRLQEAWQNGDQPISLNWNVNFHTEDMFHPLLHAAIPAVTSLSSLTCLTWSSTCVVKCGAQW